MFAYRGPPADLETRKRLAREIEPLRRRQRAALRLIQTEVQGKADAEEVNQLSGELDEKPSAEQVVEAIMYAVQGLDTPAARQSAIAQAIANLASKSALAAAEAKIPLISSDTPMAETTGGSAGMDGLKVPSDKHQHPRLTATATGTLRTNAAADTGAGALVPGDAVVTFTRTFQAKPSVIITAIDDNSINPVPRFKVRRWLRPDGQLWSSGYAYGGCVIYGDRARPLPTLAPIGALALITALITALNTILASLSGFMPYEPASGASFSLIALQQS